MTGAWPRTVLKATPPAPPHYMASPSQMETSSSCRMQTDPSHHPDAAILLACQAGPILQSPKQNRKKWIIFLPLLQCLPLRFPSLPLLSNAPPHPQINCVRAIQGQLESKAEWLQSTKTTKKPQNKIKNEERGVLKRNRTREKATAAQGKGKWGGIPLEIINTPGTFRTKPEYRHLSSQLCH